MGPVDLGTGSLEQADPSRLPGRTSRSVTRDRQSLERSAPKMRHRADFSSEVDSCRGDHETQRSPSSKADGVPAGLLIELYAKEVAGSRLFQQTVERAIPVVVL